MFQSVLVYGLFFLQSDSQYLLKSHPFDFWEELALRLASHQLVQTGNTSGDLGLLVAVLWFVFSMNRTLRVYVSIQKATY